MSAGGFVSYEPRPRPSRGGAGAGLTTILASSPLRVIFAISPGLPGIDHSSRTRESLETTGYRVVSWYPSSPCLFGLSLKNYN